MARLAGMRRGGHGKNFTWYYRKIEAAELNCGRKSGGSNIVGGYCIEHLRRGSAGLGALCLSLPLDFLATCIILLQALQCEHDLTCLSVSRDRPVQPELELFSTYRTKFWQLMIGLSLPVSSHLSSFPSYLELRIVYLLQSSLLH